MPYPQKLHDAAILDEALELIRKGGVQALSMRALGDALGVQASSLYRHFPNRGSLEGRLADHAAGLLEAQMQKVSRGKSDADACRAASKEYVRFAREEPALFDLLLAPSENTAPRPGGKSLWNLILKIVGGVTGNPDDTPAAVALWAFLHGFAVLEHQGQFGADGPRGAFETGIDALVAGLPKAKPKPRNQRADTGSSTKLVP